MQGHVDGVGEIVDRRARPPGAHAPPTLLRYVVEKGSITVDGISLTVVDAARRRLHRRRHPAHRGVTTLGHKGAGDPVNLEVDVIAKYVERLLAPG